jgi:hypothetical protein
MKLSQQNDEKLGYFVGIPGGGGGLGLADRVYSLNILVG